MDHQPELSPERSLRKRIPNMDKVKAINDLHSKFQNSCQKMLERRYKNIHIFGTKLLRFCVIFFQVSLQY